MKTALAALFVALALTAAAATSGAHDRDARDDEARETRQALLDVEATLRSHEVSALSPEQRSARERALAELHRYAVAGVFPHNHSSPELLPIFVDEHGTLCAFANLLAFSGRGAFVKRIAATRNGAKVVELAAEPEVASWSRESGISIGEAAMIQRPGYRVTPREQPVDATAVAPVATTGVTVARR
jgi:hypothetical protein